MFQRHVIHQYDDPVDLIWVKAANDLGLTIVRSMETFAAYDGNGTLTISEAADFDADDCLAQMIFHEICHWLVAGRRANTVEDWGLSNVDDRDLVYEQAAHRVQAALSQPWGLRDFMAVTTDWRPHWDGLADDPLADGDDPAIAIARDGFDLAKQKPFKEVLARALSATAAIADAVRDCAAPNSLWSQTRPRHRLGGLLCDSRQLKCGTCAWAMTQTESGGETLACRQHKPMGEEIAPPVDAAEHACERWEAKFSIDDCGQCGACCREGFDVLEVSQSDPFAEMHPELVQIADGELRVPRPDGLCVALDGDGKSRPWRCRHYATRPGNCQDFEVGGDACLLARRRVGLSR